MERKQQVILRMALHQVNLSIEQLTMAMCVADRVDVVQRGLPKGARNLDSLGLFLKFPATSDRTSFANGKVKLLPLRVRVDVTPARDVQYYLTTTGEIIELERMAGKMLWDLRQTLTDSEELTQVGKIGFSVMKETLLSFQSTPQAN
jgi:hypothetical protein